MSACATSNLSNSVTPTAARDAWRVGWEAASAARGSPSVSTAAATDWPSAETGDPEEQDWEPRGKQAGSPRHRAGRQGGWPFEERLHRTSSPVECLPGSCVGGPQGRGR